MYKFKPLFVVKKSYKVFLKSYNLLLTSAVLYENLQNKMHINL